MKIRAETARIVHVWLLWKSSSGRAFFDWSKSLGVINHNDHLGTPQKMTDASGTVVWAADYKPFGEVNITTSTITNNLRLPGQYYDQETGLHYNYFRDYNPAIARYIEADRIGLSGGINLYRYVGNNPIIYIDLLGLSRATVDRGNQTITVTDSNGNVIGTYPAGNNTTNPTGDPNTVGSNGPAPAGTFPVQPPVNTNGQPEYGPYFWPIGDVGPNGERRDIARQRGIGLHCGRRNSQSRTQGCIRMNDDDCERLFRATQNDRLTEITIQ